MSSKDGPDRVALGRREVEVLDVVAEGDRERRGLWRCCGRVGLNFERQASRREEGERGGEGAAASREGHGGAPFFLFLFSGVPGPHA